MKKSVIKVIKDPCFAPRRRSEGVSIHSSGICQPERVAVVMLPTQVMINGAFSLLLSLPLLHRAEEEGLAVVVVVMMMMMEPLASKPALHCNHPRQRYKINIT